MKDRISTICLAVYVILLVLAEFVPAASGGMVGWFCIMALIALLPVVAGPRRYRILGVVALLVAIAFAGADYQAGKRLHDRARVISEGRTDDTR